MRATSQDAPSHLVELDADHPGFRDGAYRARRDALAAIAAQYTSGDRVPNAPYVAAEHQVWRRIQARLAPLHDTHACELLNDARRALFLPEDRIPQLEEVNALLAKTTGFRMEPVAGLVDARAFMIALGRGVFRSTQYIRHASKPFYTPEPDVVHEIVGHAASLSNPRIAAVSRAFGRAAGRADNAQMERLNRVYWFTMEFGVVLERDRPRAFGAGLLSSVDELVQLAEGPELLPLDFDRMASTPYDPTDLQPRLFIADSTEELLDRLGAWLERA